MPFFEDNVFRLYGDIYYVNAGVFGVYWLFQILNGAIQHTSHTTYYLLYLPILHGPILLYSVFFGQWFQQSIVVRCRYKMITDGTEELPKVILWPLGR